MIGICHENNVVEIVIKEGGSETVAYSGRFTDEQNADTAIHLLIELLFQQVAEIVKLEKML